MIAHRTVAALVAASLALAPASAVHAQQRVAPAGVHSVHAARVGTAAPNGTTAIADGRAGRVFDHTVNGLLIGAGAGLLYVLAWQAVADGNDDGPPVIVLLPAAGTIVGAVVGTVVGLVRTTPPERRR